MIYAQTADIPGFEHMTTAEAERAAFQMGHPAAGLLAMLADAGQLADSGIDAHIQEARCQYPAEDFLHSVTDDLLALAKNMRGPNRAELLRIIEALDDLAQCTLNASEYGRSELDKAEAEFIAYKK